MPARRRPYPGASTGARRAANAHATRSWRRHSNVPSKPVARRGRVGGAGEGSRRTLERSRPRAGGRQAMSRASDIGGARRDRRAHYFTSRRPDYDDTCDGAIDAREAHHPITRRTRGETTGSAHALGLALVGLPGIAARWRPGPSPAAAAGLDEPARVTADVILKGGTVIDGTGRRAVGPTSPPRDRIVAVGSFEADPGAKVIDARG